jgi:hypothetical protein
MKNDNWEDLDFGGEQKRMKIDQICARQPMKNDNWEDLDFGGDQKRTKIGKICAHQRMTNDKLSFLSLTIRFRHELFVRFGFGRGVENDDTGQNFRWLAALASN